MILSFAEKNNIPPEARNSAKAPRASCVPRKLYSPSVFSLQPDQQAASFHDC